MALRDSPMPFALAFIRPLTLVAMTTSSRGTIESSAGPVISSDVPSEYTLAVSKKLMPASSAWRKYGSAPSRSIDHDLATRARDAVTHAAQGDA